jgi:hypothetical protein
MVKFKKYDMKTMGIILYLSILLAGCNRLFPDEELLLPRTNYEGTLKISGYYYYYQQDPTGTIVKYLFRNGIILSGYFFSTIDLNEVEIEMIKEYNLLQKDKSRWGVFVINGNTIQYSGWSTSVGGGLPTGKCIGTIENDTTFCITKSINSDGREFERNDVYHFRQFSPKPDSTNNFIP